MAQSGERTLGGGTNARPLRDAGAATAPGGPDHAIGPEDRTIPEPTDLANSAEGWRIEQKLRAEAPARRRGDDDDDGVDDPTGHA